jgi:hypothetical protein
MKLIKKINPREGGSENSSPLFGPRNPINDNVYLTWKFNIGGIPSNLYIKLHK